MNTNADVNTSQSLAVHSARLLHPQAPTKAPTFAYPGGKARLASTIIKYVPQHGQVFADVFAGRGNVTFKVMVTPGIDYETYWSNDCRTAPFFHALLSDGNNIVVPERSREEYHRQKANYPSPTSLLLEPMLTYSGAGYWHGGFRVTTGGPKRESYETTLRTAHELLAIHRPWITDWDYKKVLSQLGQDSFAFLDPPYLNANVTAYKPSDLDHREMVSLLLTAKYRWILCEYDNALYTEAFGQPFWRRDMQICMTTRYKADKAVRRIGTECMWRNF